MESKWKSLKGTEVKGDNCSKNECNLFQFSESRVNYMFSLFVNIVVIRCRRLPLCVGAPALSAEHGSLSHTTTLKSGLIEKERDSHGLF